jgi:hypothetical protein
VFDTGWTDRHRLIANVVFIRWSDDIGRKRVLLGIMIVLCIGTVLCILSTTLLGRVLQGGCNVTFGRSARPSRARIQRHPRRLDRQKPGDSTIIACATPADAHDRRPLLVVQYVSLGRPAPHPRFVPRRRRRGATNSRGACGTELADPTTIRGRSSLRHKDQLAERIEYIKTRAWPRFEQIELAFSFFQPSVNKTPDLTLLRSNITRRAPTTSYCSR